MNLKTVKARVRALVGDPDADWTEDAYLLPLINVAYDDIILKTKNASGKNLEQVLDLPAIPAATQDLKSYQAAGKSLGTLTDPLFIWWKIQNQPVSRYCQAIKQGTLPPVDESGISWYSNLYWTYLSETVFLTPMQSIVDLRMHGRFDPPELIKDEDVLQCHKNIGVPLIYATAALIGVDNKNDNWTQNYGNQAMAGVDNVVADIIRQGQGEDSRFGRSGRPRECGWYWL